jgi:hypothetical protein
MEWSYGFGREGIKRAPGVQVHLGCVIIDIFIPWWLPMAKSEDVNVYSVWLTNYSETLSQFLENWRGNTPVDISATCPLSVLTALRQCPLVLIGGRLPDCFSSENIWKSPELRMIVTTQGSREQPPKPWRMAAVKVSHGNLGGVTNGSHKLYFYTREQVFDQVPQYLRKIKGLPQDLRWVMKAGVEGQRTDPPDNWKISAPVQRVVYVRSGTISSVGLFPMECPRSQVLTEFGGPLWVIRHPSPSELLKMMDFPEKHIILLDEETRVYISGMLEVPGKVLQAASKQAAYALRFCSPSILGKRPRESHSERNSAAHNIEARNQGSDGMPEGENLFGVIPVSARKRHCRLLTTVREFSGDEAKPPAKELVKSADYNVATESCGRVPVEDPNTKATKSDDAAVRMEIWNVRLQKGLQHQLPESFYGQPIERIRRLLLTRWMRNVYMSFRKWGRTQIAQGQPITALDLEAVRECLSKCCDASWWHWDRGSRPMFWKWPIEYQETARDGVQPWIRGTIQPWMRKQRKTRLPAMFETIREKLQVIRVKGYVGPGQITSLMPFFEVAKGSADVRMVYDGSASGLNDKLWAPWFPLPTVDCLVRSLDPGYGMADNDVGEMFHNFMLHDVLKPYCGLDLTRYFLEEAKPGSPNFSLHERWERLAMGLRTSPYAAVQGILIAEEVLLGNPLDEQNIFRWARVRFNLPGSQSYDPSKSWVCKVRSDGQVAANVFIYVDDIRSSAPTLEEAWTASQRISSVLASLGLQDAARKRRDPGMETGAWTGSVVWTSEGSLTISTTQEKWDKVKNQLKWIHDGIDSKKGMDQGNIWVRGRIEARLRIHYRTSG